MGDKKYYNEVTKVIHVPEHELDFHQDGFGCLIFERIKLYKNKILQIDTESDQEDTGASLLQRSIRTALEMRARGVKENDVITVCSHNHINSIVPVIAATFIGAIPANVDPAFSQDDLIHLINLVEPKLVFASSEKFEDVSSLELQCKPEIISFSVNNEQSSFGSFLREVDNEKQFLPIKKSIDDVAVIFFSSGTSGLSKGICQTGKNILYHDQGLFNECNRFLLYTSLYWISSYLCTIISLLNGSARVLCPRFDPAAAWNLFAKYKVEGLFMNPNKVSQIIQYKPKVELPHLKIILVGGSTVCMEHLNTLKEFVPNAKVMGAYGQTEVFSAFDLNPTFDMGNYESVGVCAKGKALKVVDIETEEPLGFNQPGELRVKSKYLTTGYYKNDCVTKNAFDSDGFFKTGDVLYYDENFCFYIVDRTKEMFKFRGWHVVPAKIENILRKHPGVLNAVVIGIPDVIEENLPLAFVIPKINYELEAEEVEKFANNLLDDIHKIRAGVEIVNEFPLTPSGKILRRKLKEMYLSNKQ